MRNLGDLKKWSVCLVAAVAACSAPAGNDSADGNAGAEAAVEAGNDAAGNEAASPADGNETAAPAEGDAAADVAATYRASGTEPFWSLTMTDAQMVYNSADGPDVTVATPEPRSTRTGPVYETPELTVWINQVQRCPDTEGPARQDVVRVTIGAQTVNGCGNGVFPR